MIFLISARFGARLAQAFTSTRKSITLKPDQISEIPDVESNGYIFTDGVGKISYELAKEAWYKLEDNASVKKIPSAFQFRLGGLKGN